VNAKDRKRVRQLFALMGSANEAESAAARKKLEALLKRLGKSWNDLPELLTPDAPTGPQPDPRDAVDPSSHPFDTYTPADTVRGIIERYVVLEPHEAVAVALWAIHTHVFDKFMVTPRLLFTSPVRNCGKTTLLSVLDRLVARPEKTDNTTPAWLYHHIHTHQRTLLIDEADNMELSSRAALRAVLNAGHRKGGNITRMFGREPKRFRVFAPIALSGIGSLASLPLMSRSVVIHMRRQDAKSLATIERFDENNVDDLNTVYAHTRYWVAKTELNPNPEMPAGVHGRAADNWRPLLAIADACGPAWSKLAHDAAVAFARTEQDEDAAVMLLRHIKAVFNERETNTGREVDRLPSKLLVRDLINLDAADGMWAEYRGPIGNERPRKLTQVALAGLLKPFLIRPRPLWPGTPRTAATKCARGYYKGDFEAAWRSYCDEGETPSQPRRLRLVK
jgi:Protein of unknown function (DUF3631)